MAISFRQLMMQGGLGVNFLHGHLDKANLA